MTARSPGTVLGADPLNRVALLPGVNEAATSARTAVDALLRHRVLRRRSADVTAEASLRAARASAALEGHDVSLAALRARLGADPTAGTGDSVDTGDSVGTGDSAGAPGSDPTQAVTLGVVRLYAELGTLVSAWERAPRQALARMHVLAGRGLVPDEKLGRPRSDPAAPSSDPLRLGPPPPPVEMSARLEGLSGLLVAPTAAPAIVVAAVVHGELLAIRPFGVLDGIIARAAARLVLISRGLDPKALTATDVGHLDADGDRAEQPAADGAAGGAAVGTTGYRDAIVAYIGGGEQGVTRWVQHCAWALELAARESSAVCEALSRA